MNRRFLPTISEVITLSEPQVVESQDAKLSAQEWCAAIAALSQLLQQVTILGPPDPVLTYNLPTRGVVLTGPAPVFSNAVVSEFATWVFTTPNPFPVALQPAQGHEPLKVQDAKTIPVLPGDPIGAEQFCLVLTVHFSLVMALAKTATGQSAFMFSFDPETVKRAWAVLRVRTLLTQPGQVDPLDTLVRQFVPTEPHYTTVMQFSRLLLKSTVALPQPPPKPSTGVKPDRVAVDPAQWVPVETEFEGNLTHAALPQGQSSQADRTNPGHFQSLKEPQTLSEAETSLDVELLQAIAHEIRTPLATISTLTRLLLKRSDLPAEVVKRLEAIYRECSEQIDRFSLIFRAVELETSQRQHWPPVRQESPLAGPSSMQLTSISLAQVLQQSIPRWQKQAARRDLNLHVSLPQNMPAVVSDPTVLDQVLTGLIDRFTRSLPAGSHIHVQVSLAGDQLKLQFRPQCSSTSADHSEAVDAAMPVLKSVGQLLMLQPETGTLSLSLPVTKNLFQALGGKFTVRRRPQQGEVLTIFLPLGGDSNAYE